MNDAPASILSNDIGLALLRIVAEAKDRLVIVAPFIKQGAFERLLAVASPSLSLIVCTRWNLSEIAAGVSDLGVFDVMQSRPGSRMLLHPRLHAKVILIDDTVAVAGSANISDSALAFCTPANIEIMAELRPVPNRLQLFLRDLERTSTPATEALRQRLEAAVNALPPRPTSPDFEPDDAPPASVMPFPCFRSPDRLYEGYLSVREFRDPETRDAILDDLGILALPDGLSEGEFAEHIGRALLALPYVAAFDVFVAQPRYFREMNEWLLERGILIDRVADERKRYLQTLIRWLRHFLPGRYRLEVPNYSERFGRSDGWTGSITG